MAKGLGGGETRELLPPSSAVLGVVGSRIFVWQHVREMRGSCLRDRISLLPVFTPYLHPLPSLMLIVWCGLRGGVL